MPLLIAVLAFLFNVVNGLVNVNNVFNVNFFVIHRVGICPYARRLSLNIFKVSPIEKDSLTRDEFLKYAWEWKEKYGGIILDQLKKLGASCDWSRTKFTMDEDLSKSVIKVFIDLYNKGHIYRGIRMVNWDPEGKTAR